MPGADEGIPHGIEHCGMSLVRCRKPVAQYYTYDHGHVPARVPHVPIVIILLEMGGVAMLPE
eukprot:16038779-Heterocapsa_arctica.AAC.1